MRLHPIIDKRKVNFRKNSFFFTILRSFLFHRKRSKLEHVNKSIKSLHANKEFLNSHDARSIRVLCELTEPDVRLQNEGVENTIVFFGSARSKPLAVAKDELSSYLDEIPSQNELDLDQKEELAKKGKLGTSF